MSSFNPPFLLRNRHLQTILSSDGPRKKKVAARSKSLAEHSKTHILTCSDGIRLQGEYSPAQRPAKGLVILIHGWEGSARSLDILSAASHLYDNDYSIFRLNLRDHGYTHHLNASIFKATDLQEVVDAVTQIFQLFPHDKKFLCGFSLGGNFALRVAAALSKQDAADKPDKVVAICPVLDPVKTLCSVESGLSIYQKSLTQKYRRSLRLKLKEYPDLNIGSDLPRLTTLRKLNDYMVDRFSNFSSTDEYLANYAVTGDALKKLTIDTRIILSEDDPMVEKSDLQRLYQPASLTIETTRHGGHCGFLDSWSYTSWIDRRLTELFSNS